MPLLVLVSLTVAAQLASVVFTSDNHFADIFLPSTVALLLVTTPLAALGLWLGSGIGLGTPLLAALLRREPGALRQTLGVTALAVVIGLLVGSFLWLLRIASADYLPPELPALGHRGAVGGLLVSISAAIGEEVWLRLGVMTMLAWLLFRVLGRKALTPGVAWTAILLAAFAFGAIHLPQLAASGAATPVGIIATMLGNSLVGIVCGWFFWRHGILAAIAAHFAVDVMLHVVPALFLAAGTPHTDADSSLGRLSYSSFRPPAWDLYLLEAGEPPQALVAHPALDYGPAVSPDGRWLVFTSERDGGPDLWALDLENRAGPVKLVESAAMEDQAAFSPDGEAIVFVGTSGGTADLYRIRFDPETTQPIAAAQQLTDHPRAELRPVFDQDGSGIIFTSNRDAVDKGHRYYPFAIMSSGDLYRLDTVSGDVDRLTTAKGWDGSAAVAADGAAVYFYSERGDSYPRLHRMGREGSAPELLVPDEPALSPAPLDDGSVVYVSAPAESDDPGPPRWTLRRLMQDGTRQDVPTGELFCHEVAAVPGRDAVVCQGMPRAWYEEPPAVGAFPGPLLAAGFPRQQELGGKTVDLFAFAHAFSVPLHPAKNEVARLGTLPYALATQGLAEEQMTGIVSFAAEEEALREARRAIMGISYSENGDQVTFALKAFRRSDVEGDVYVVNADGTSLRNLTLQRLAGAGMPDFGDGDGKVVFAAREGEATDLFIVNLDGTGLRNLTNSPEWRENFPAFSNDGRYLAFSSDRQGALDESSGERSMDIFLGELDSNGELGAVRKLSDGPGQKAHPRFSPDGRWLVYTSGSGGINDEYPPLSAVLFTPQLYGEIHAYNLEQGYSVRLTHDKWEDGAPFWVPPLAQPQE